MQFCVHEKILFLSSSAAFYLLILGIHPNCLGGKTHELYVHGIEGELLRESHNSPNLPIFPGYSGLLLSVLLSDAYLLQLLREARQGRESDRGVSLLEARPLYHNFVIFDGDLFHFFAAGAIPYGLKRTIGWIGAMPFKRGHIQRKSPHSLENTSFGECSRSISLLFLTWKYISCE